MITLIKEARAREIASWWQTPRNSLGIYASTGTITDDLADDITYELDCERDLPLDDADRATLLQLLTYVRAQSITVWHVGNNEAGYLPTDPESVTHMVSYRNAIAAYTDLLDAAADNWAANETLCECGAEAAELCEYCSTKACAASMIADDVRTLPADQEISHSIIICERRIEFWMRSETMTYGRYVDEYRDTSLPGKPCGLDTELRRFLR